MRFAPFFLLAATLAFGARPVIAQQQLHFMRESVLTPVSAEDRVLVDKVRDDLARVRVAEEAYFAANQNYSPELSDLKGLKLSSGASIVVLMSGPMGWKAQATHASLKGAEVVHVMRMDPGQKCPMMEMGGMGGMGGMDHGAMGGMGGMQGGMKMPAGEGCCGGGSTPPPAPQHQH
jgi:hypothetical protein